MILGSPSGLSHWIKINKLMAPFGLHRPFPLWDMGPFMVCSNGERLRCNGGYASRSGNSYVMAGACGK